jgi:hypothetical protein
MSRTSKYRTKGAGLGEQRAVKSDPLLATEEQIRRRAYELYLARGGKPGDALRDWLQAENELAAKLVHR